MYAGEGPQHHVIVVAPQRVDVIAGDKQSLDGIQNPFAVRATINVIAEEIKPVRLPPLDQAA